MISAKVRGNAGFSLVEALLGVSLLAISTFLAMHILSDIADRKAKTTFNNHLVHMRTIVESPFKNTETCTAHFKELALDTPNPETTVLPISQLARDPAKTTLIFEVGQKPHLKLRGFDAVVTEMRLRNFKKINDGVEIFGADQTLLSGQTYYSAKFQVDFSKPSVVGPNSTFSIDTPVILEVSTAGVIRGCSNSLNSVVKVKSEGLTTAAVGCQGLISAAHSQSASIIGSHSFCHCGCDPSAHQCGTDTLGLAVNYYDASLNQWVTSCEDRTCTAHTEVYCAVSKW